MSINPGTVYLVGGGPGDAGLLTLRASALLRSADVVLFDRLVGEEILLLAAPGAELIDVGKGPVGDSDSQKWINAELVAQARKNRVVVRLKGGDPFVFGRGWEELEYCRDHGVSCEVVPGISSALAAPAAADIPITCRNEASSFAVFAAPALNSEQLIAAANIDTAVFLMGVRGLSELVQSLIGAGRNPDTPAALIERATQPGQFIVRSPLHAIAKAASEHRIAPPAVLVVGPTARTRFQSSGLLSGLDVVVTRPVDSSGYLQGRLEALGAHVTLAPCIAIAPLTRVRASDHKAGFSFQRLREYDHIVFTSRHGVRGFRSCLESAGLDVRSISHATIAVVGPTTARELRTWGLQADIVADPARAEVLVDRLLSKPVRPQKVLFPCGNLALSTVPASLALAGVHVQRVVVYETRHRALSDHARTAIARGIDAILFASPSAVESALSAGVTPSDAIAVCIGPTTASSATRAGWPNVRVAVEHSDDGLIDSLMAAVKELASVDGEKVA